MLTDIFAARYVDTPLWEEFGEAEQKLLVQGFRIVSEQLFPYWIDGKENARTKTKWSAIHDKLSMELGLEELAPRYYAHTTVWNGKQFTHSRARTVDKVCNDFVCANYDASVSADRFMKERISFLELAFREREEELKEINRELPRKLAAAEVDAKKPQRVRRRLRLPGNPVDGIKAVNERLNQSFRASVEELNQRLRLAGCGLHYHNGYIQLSADELSQIQIETPFWALVADDALKNVDFDMKEAIDRRDNSQRDPAWYAARSLESAIKIVSDQKGWTHGGEKGAHNYVDNLCKNGLITEWEKDALKHFFTKVRNPLGHGPGGEKMPELSPQQSTWAIETCMGWIKSILQRL